MGLLVFLLTLLVTIDHFVKYRPSGLVYYKNEHKFSIIVAVDGINPNLQKLMDHAEKSKHQFIFVSINGVLPKDTNTNLTIVEVDVECNNEEYIRRTPLLSQAYVEGYKHAEHEFLLFMDAYHMFDNFKTIDHMANNLVEHQIYTIKETLPLRHKKEGYKLFFDLLRDMNVSDDMINFGFYAVKRETYELTGCHENVYKEPSDFIENIAQRNVNIVHINHARTIYRGEDQINFKSFMKTWFTDYKCRKDILGLKRMLLFLLAYHIFYFYLIFDMVLNGIRYHYFALIVLVHVAFYIAVRAYTKHKTFNFVFLPIYMLFFDIALLWGNIKRFFYKTKEKRRLKQLEKDNDHEELLP